jgi:hypothetical protein
MGQDRTGDDVNTDPTDPTGMAYDGNTEPTGMGQDRGVGGIGNDANTVPGGMFYERAAREAIADPMPLNPNLPPIKVWTLSREQFRDRLIENFSIRWMRKEIVWPSRAGLQDSFPRIN